MVCILGMNVRDAVVETDPFVSVIVCPHAVIEHSSPLLDQFGQITGCSVVLGILIHMIHHENDLLAHDGALNGRIPTVQQVFLIFFDGLLNPVLQNFLGSRVL